jgi:hypothetical protein
MGARSTDRLVAALREAGAPPALVAQAESDAFHDFRSASATPISDLVSACELVGLRGIADRARDGEFDAGSAEADEWAASPEGRDALRRSAWGGDTP